MERLLVTPRVSPWTWTRLPTPNSNNQIMYFYLIEIWNCYESFIQKDFYPRYSEEFTSFQEYLLPNLFLHYWRSMQCVKRCPFENYLSHHTLILICHEFLYLEYFGVLSIHFSMPLYFLLLERRFEPRTFKAKGIPSQ